MPALFKTHLPPRFEAHKVLGLLSGVVYFDSLLAFVLGNISRGLGFYSVDSVVDTRLEYCHYKPCSGDKSFLVAIVDVTPKSVTWREDHGIKVLCLSISWNYFSEL
jgi:hypothetical protein